MEWPGLRPVLVLLSGEAEERVWEAHTCKKPTLIFCTGCLVHHSRCGAEVWVGREKTLLLNVCVFKKTSVVFGFVKQEETDWWLFKMGKQTTLSFLQSGI